MTALILDWPAACESGPARAGGKGWQLGVLTELGAPVPSGFVIDAAAGTGRRPGDPLPVSLVTALSRELERRDWSDRPLAVRSSASSEDSARASFAGIYRSCLNVRGVEAVLRAVQEIFDSLWAPAAVAYRQRLGITDHDVAMGVVIMPLLPAVAAGIAFTCDPISGREDQLVIHAHWGLGEALVAGQAEGDEYRLQENYLDDTLTLIGQRLGSKARSTVPAIHGGTELRDTPPELAARSVLSAEQTIALGELVRDVAFALDYANPFYDVEWVWDGKRFWIVQARPITARGRYTYPTLANQPALWSRANSRDVVPDPLSPMDWSLSRTLLNRMVTRTSAVAGYETLPGAQRTSLRQGRLYFETSILQWEAFDGFGVSPKSYNQLLGGHQPEIAVPKANLRARLLRVQRGVRFLLRCVRPRLHAQAVFERACRQAAERLAMELPANHAELARQLREQIVVVHSADDLFLLQAAGSALFILLDFLEKHCPGQGHALTAALMAGGKPSVTAAQSYALMELARIAASDPLALAWLRSPARIGTEWSRQLTADNPFRLAFADFLQRYGHRAVYESYLRNPRWREAPDYLLDSVVNLIGCDPALLRKRQFEVSVQSRQRINRALPFWHRPLIPILVKFATVERNLREGARSALMAHVEVVRRYAMALGQRSVGPVRLENPLDIFNLTMLELLALAEDRMSIAVAAKRAAWRCRQLEGYALQVEPEVIVEHRDAASQCIPVASSSASTQENLWHGTVAGSGQARSVAHIARHPTEALNMAAGAILVTPSTDPSWTPLFLKAGALVMETGGFLSHGAIVAREFGIPAVVNLPGILNQIRNGDLLDVDGSQGTVRRL